MWPILPTRQTHQYTGPKSSLASSSAFALNPSSAIRFAYRSSACLYSCGLSSAFAACSLLSRWPSVSAALHHAGRTFSARALSTAIRSLIAPSMIVTGPRAADWLFVRWRPCHASEPSAHHGSLSFVHASSAGSYECVTPSESWITGAPFGRMEVEAMVRFGEAARMGLMDAGENLAACLRTSLKPLSVVESEKGESDVPDVEHPRDGQSQEHVLGSS